MKKTKWTYMAGTEGTGAYKTVLKTRYGKLGVRDLGALSTLVRVRIEPAKDEKIVAKIAGSLSRGLGWKQPGDGGQHRFSVVVERSGLSLVLTAAKLALGVGRLKSIQNPVANMAVKQLVA